VGKRPTLKAKVLTSTPQVAGGQGKGRGKGESGKNIGYTCGLDRGKGKEIKKTIFVHLGRRLGKRREGGGGEKCATALTVAPLKKKGKVAGYAGTSSVVSNVAGGKREREKKLSSSYHTDRSQKKKEGRPVILPWGEDQGRGRKEPAWQATFLAGCLKGKLKPRATKEKKRGMGIRAPGEETKMADGPRLVQGQASSKKEEKKEGKKKKRWHFERGRRDGGHMKKKKKLTAIKTKNPVRAAGRRSNATMEEKKGKEKGDSH